MSRLSRHDLKNYADLLGQIRVRIRQAQTRAVLSANTEMIRLYWDVGRLLASKQIAEGWGAGVIPRLAADLKNELPEQKGFSERNLKYMIRFAREYPESSIVQQPAAQLPSDDASPIVQQPVAQLARPGKQLQTAGPSAAADGQIIWLIPWGHHVLLMEKIKDLPTRLWYMQQTIAQGWSRNVLLLMIQGQAHLRQGAAITNFPSQLPPEQSDLALQALKDPYIFDFLTLEEPFHERELETHLLHHLEKFLIELGRGFAFVGRQYHVEVGDEDFYIDLLFYHLTLRSFIVIELKKGSFKAEYAGKMNFYLNVIDDQLRHEHDNPSIGLILCQERNRVLAEYALRGMDKPIGVSEYELTRALPKALQSSLPSIEDIEAELATPPKKTAKTKARKASSTRGKR